ncbi:putative gustatory receptor 36a [Drosophila eugracilis]|uniref:putative gustatory receptor 36a n=1 Tax=Drosophila eugracilis TaxID=29029 RepID=UPI001BDA56C6|nr:putative gustatory receptor 36a [Drosophila eugracilis]
MGGMNSAQMVGLALQFWTSTILNLAVSQHYLVMLFIRSQYQHINTELQKLVEECKMLSHIPKRKGVFMTRCCYLSDKLDDIAKLQSHLQWIITQLGAIIGLQGVMVYGGYYFSSVVALYMTYSLFKYGHENLNLTLDIVIMAFVWNFFFYLDAMLNLLNTLFVLDDHNKMVRLLEERTLFSSSLDVRLEESFEKLQLQLVRNPMSINVMKLFPVTRSSTAAMCGSIITHSIFLIQYDMENF